MQDHLTPQYRERFKFMVQKLFDQSNPTGTQSNPTGTQSDRIYNPIFIHSQFVYPSKYIDDLIISCLTEILASTGYEFDIINYDAVDDVKYLSKLVQFRKVTNTDLDLIHKDKKPRIDE
jgi:hypothetical protein